MALAFLLLLLAELQFAYSVSGIWASRDDCVRASEDKEKGVASLLDRRR